MKTFVMGDMHGAHLALKQCLERSNFDYDNDTLIQLGDVADGWAYVYECVEELLGIRYLIAIRGNHDEWFRDFIESGFHPDRWMQGGYNTARSYLRQVGREDSVEAYTPRRYLVPINNTDIPLVHQEFFRNQVNYHLIGDKLFIHAGFDRLKPLVGQPEYVTYWNRELWYAALSHEENSNIAGGKFRTYDNYSEIFIGHTDLNHWNTDKPMKAAEYIWNLDTGAGFKGKLTIMDISTHEYWQSDNVQELYPNERGR